jgi:hypothetical protein
MQGARALSASSSFALASLATGRFAHARLGAVPDDSRKHVLFGLVNLIVAREDVLALYKRFELLEAQGLDALEDELRN